MLYKNIIEIFDEGPRDLSWDLLRCFTRSVQDTLYLKEKLKYNVVTKNFVDELFFVKRKRAEFIYYAFSINSATL